MLVAPSPVVPPAFPDPSSDPQQQPRRYVEGKDKSEFRNYGEKENPAVAEFYRTNHINQTVDFVLKKKSEFYPLSKTKMSVWGAIEFLNTLVDESDPDTDFSQLDHALQASEALRRDNKPRWMILTGFLHDLGKVLCLWGEPQWGVVGDTFPVGCQWDERIIFHKYFEGNPDAKVPLYQSKYGMYTPNCGLSNIHMSWGHDAYLGKVMEPYLPESALYCIKYHSFYSWHKEGAYDHLCDEKDREMLKWVQEFNPYDLYSKGAKKPVFEELKPYYDTLFDEFLPHSIAW